ncbi:MAG: glutaminyl-peptide cyclotransferase [Candidatus Kapaibacteriota bacterium]
MIYALILALLLFSNCTNSHKEYKIREEKPLAMFDTLNKINNEESTIIPVYKLKVSRRIPHDTLAFTQGLFFHNGFLYESTGQYGKSSLRKINPINGEILKKIDLEPYLFAEGIALYKNKIYMLTWQNNTCLVFDIHTFKKIDEKPFIGEGWGITNFDENTFIQSDGTNILKIIDPDNLQILRIIQVFADKIPVSNINELERISDDIWANIWMSDTIAIIDKNSGKVRFYVDASELRKFIPPSYNIDVLNGIAYDPKRNTIYLTGKLWPFIFEVEVLHR